NFHFAEAMPFKSTPHPHDLLDTPDGADDEVFVEDLCIAFIDKIREDRYAVNGRDTGTALFNRSCIRNSVGRIDIQEWCIACQSHIIEYGERVRPDNQVKVNTFEEDDLST